MLKLFSIKQAITFVILCLIVVGCSSYTPYRYSFSLIGPQSEINQNDARPAKPFGQVVGQEMSFEDENVQFKFVPSAENIRVAIKNKTGHQISLVRDNAKYIDFSGESLGLHYGYDYVQQVVNFAIDMYAPQMNVAPNSEIAGYVWINNWPDFHIGRGPGNFPISMPNIDNRKEPFFPRYSFEGKGEDLKGSTFNLVLPIDFGEYVHDYTFTFKIDDVL